MSLALDWLREPAREPFFLWGHLFDPHQPYAPPPEQRDAYLDEKPRESERELFTSKAGTPRGLVSLAKLESARAQAIDRVARAYYRAEIAFLDDQLGRLVEALKRSQLYRQTLVAFLSDHGESFLDRGVDQAFGHRTLHREVSHLPLLLKPPESLGGPRRQRYPGLVGNLDVAPTLLEMLGIDAPAEWTGRSFWSAIGRGEAFREQLVLEGSFGSEVGIRTPHLFYRELRNPSKRAALGYGPRRSYQLYDLRADPNEQQDLGARSSQAAERMHAAVEAFLDGAARPAEVPSLTPGQRETLKALGYLD